MEPLLKGLGSVLIAYSTHYGVTKLYNEFCVPDGVIGYFQGMLTTGSPVCAAGIKLATATQVSYSSMIILGLTRLAIDWVAPGSGDTVKTE